MWKKISTVFLLIVAILVLAISFFITLRQQNGKRFNNNPPVTRQNEGLVVGGVAILGITSEHKTYGEAKASYYDRTVCASGTYGSTCKTANGETFNDEAFTFASNDLRFGTGVEFVFGGKSVVCRANDTGGFNRYGRSFDLSFGCARAIGLDKAGVGNVNWRVVQEK